MKNAFTKTAALTMLGLCLILPSTNAAKSSVMYRDQVAVIMYHHIDDDAKSGATITNKLFEDQLSYLRSKGYQFITLSQFKAFMEGASVPNNAVLVTFDDGYESFYNNAYPLLKRMRIPAVNFIITGDLETPLASYVPSMSKDEIIEMTSDTNFIDAQCHSNSFHNKLPDGNPALIGRVTISNRKETDEEYKQRVVNDTKLCETKLSELYPEVIDTYAYPYGFSDKNSVSYLKESGMKFAFTTVTEMATRQLDPMQIPRINAGGSFISPEGLHSTIQRRIVDTSMTSIDVPLADTLSHLGGKVVSSGSKVTLQYQQQQWTGSTGSDKLTAADGRTITLQKPLFMKDNKLFIALKDLEQAVGSHIVYNPTVQSYSVQQTPWAQK